MQLNYANAIEGLKRFTEYQIEEMEKEQQKMKEVITIDDEKENIKIELEYEDIKTEIKVEEITELVESKGVSSKYFNKELVIVKTEAPDDPPNGSGPLSPLCNTKSTAHQEDNVSLTKLPNTQNATSLAITPMDIEQGLSVDSENIKPQITDSEDKWPQIIEIAGDSQDNTPQITESAADSQDNTPQVTESAAELMLPPPMPQSATLQNLCCDSCSHILMSGPSAYLKVVDVIDLQSVLNITGSSVITELCHPATWEIYPTQLVGTPLDLHKLPLLCDVIFDRIDRIFYRFLSCACNIHKPLGFLICEAADQAKKHHVGKVYIWKGIKSILNAEKTRMILDDLYNEVPNSQYSSSNDIFYGL